MFQVSFHGRSPKKFEILRDSVFDDLAFPSQLGEAVDKGGVLLEGEEYVDQYSVTSLL